MSYGGIVSFGGYIFDNLADFDCNFADTQPKTTLLPGMDGTWNLDGDATASAPPGTVKVKWKLVAATRADMDELRDAARQMAYYGLAKLTYQPTDDEDDERWTWARVQTLTMGQNKGENTDLWQDVEATFLCPEPVWWVDTYEDGYVINASGLSTQVTIPQNGNTVSIAEVTVEPQSGQSCQNPVIRRLVDTEIIDEIGYTGTLDAGDILDIDGKTQRVTLNGVDVWGDDFDYRHPDFLRLPPDSGNVIRVIFANSGDAAKVYLIFRDSFR